MGVEGDGGVAFDRGVARLASILDNLERGDAVSVVLFDTATEIVYDGEIEKEAVLEALRGVRPSYGRHRPAQRRRDRGAHARREPPRRARALHHLGFSEDGARCAGKGARARRARRIVTAPIRRAQRRRAGDPRKVPRRVFPSGRFFFRCRRTRLERVGRECRRAGRHAPQGGDGGARDRSAEQIARARREIPARGLDRGPPRHGKGDRDTRG